MQWVCSVKIDDKMGIRILPWSCHILDVMSASWQRNRTAIDIVLISTEPG